MSTTIPCILRELGDRNPDGFTKSDLLAAFVKEGYSADKAARRYKECVASHQITPIDGTDRWISLYSRLHWNIFPEALQDVKIVAVKIARDGSVVIL